MKLRPEEITSILKDRIEHYDVETDLAEVGTVLQVGDGIARAYGLENAVALEMLEFEHGVVGLAFNLEEDDVGTGTLRRVAARQGGRARQKNRKGRERSGRRGTARPCRRPARQSTRRRWSDRDLRDAAARVQGPRGCRAAAGEGTAPHGDQGDRRDDERRAWPAGADHRRPPDRQDDDRARHDPESEGHGREVHLCRDRPEGLDRRAGVRALPRPRRDGVHDDRVGGRTGGRTDQVDGPVRRLRDGRVLPLQRPVTRW